MVLERWISEQQRRGNKAGVQMGRTLLKLYGDVHLDDRLQRAVSEFKTQPHTPEFVTKTFQTIWQARGELVGMSFEVPSCPYTQEELAKLEKEGKRVAYLPPELSIQKTRHILGKMFPKIKSHSVQEDNSVTNYENPSGWFDYKVAYEVPPFYGSSELQGEIEEPEYEVRLGTDGGKTLNLNQYIVAGEDSKLFTGHYLDEEGRTRVRLDSAEEGRVVLVCFNRYGRLDVGRYLIAGD